MQTVWRLGLPSSNQLSGWTIISGTRANGIMGPIAERGWIRGPDRYKPLESPARRGARRAGDSPCRSSQAVIVRGSAPGRQGSRPDSRPPDSTRVQVRRTAGRSIPCRSIQHRTRSAIAPGHRLDPQAGVATSSVVSTRPNNVTAAASSTTTRTIRPTSRSGPSKTAIRSQAVRPVSWSSPAQPSRRTDVRLGIHQYLDGPADPSPVVLEADRRLRSPAGRCSAASSPARGRRRARGGRPWSLRARCT